MTESQAPTGATSSMAYEGTGQSAYNPTSSTDDAGRTSTYGYNGSGNQLSSTDASGAEAKVTRNPDGTIETATSPGNGTNSTTYGYTNRQVTFVTPVTGSSLGAKAYTYESAEVRSEAQGALAVRPGCVGLDPAGPLLGAWAGIGVGLQCGQGRG